MLRQDSKIICERYLDFVRDQSCIGCGRSPCEPHHLVPRGWREGKRNDFTSVPVCRKCHDYFERHGTDAAATEFQIDPFKCTLLLTLEFFMVVPSKEIKIERGKI